MKTPDRSKPRMFILKATIIGVVESLRQVVIEFRKRDSQDRTERIIEDRAQLCDVVIEHGRVTFAPKGVEADLPKEEKTKLMLLAYEEHGKMVVYKWNLFQVWQQARNQVNAAFRVCEYDEKRKDNKGKVIAIGSAMDLVNRQVKLPENAIWEIMTPEGFRPAEEHEIPNLSDYEDWQPQSRQSGGNVTIGDANGNGSELDKLKLSTPAKTPSPAASKAAAKPAPKAKTPSAQPQTATPAAKPAEATTDNSTLQYRLRVSEGNGKFSVPLAGGSLERLMKKNEEGSIKWPEDLSTCVWDVRTSTTAPYVPCECPAGLVPNRDAKKPVDEQPANAPAPAPKKAPEASTGETIYRLHGMNATGSPLNIYLQGTLNEIIQMAADGTLWQKGNENKNKWPATPEKFARTCWMSNETGKFVKLDEDFWPQGLDHPDYSKVVEKPQTSGSTSEAVNA